MFYPYFQFHIKEKFTHCFNLLTQFDNRQKLKAGTQKFAFGRYLNTQ